MINYNFDYKYAYKYLQTTLFLVDFPIIGIYQKHKQKLHCNFIFQLHFDFSIFIFNLNQIVQ